MPATRLQRRLMKEYEVFQNQDVSGIVTRPRDYNMNQLPQWDAWILGPQGTPYEGGLFQIHIIFPEEYPFRPPRVRFTTPIMHCNVNAQGSVNLDILSNRWSPAMTTLTVLGALRVLMRYPKTNEPLVRELAHMMIEDPAAFNARARQATLRSAIPAVQDAALGELADNIRVLILD